LVEQAMYFVAGLLVAGLAMMLILPAFWRRALRLSARRARLQTPLSVHEAIADRDQLRAEHSVSRRLLERRIEGLEAALARQRAELGREIKRATLDEDKAHLAREVASLGEQLAGKARDSRSLEAELGASQLALHDFGERLDRAQARIAALREGALVSETRADQQRMAIAGLETKSAGLEARLADQAQAFRLQIAALESARAREAKEASQKIGDRAELEAAMSEKDKLNRDLSERLASAAEGGKGGESAPERDRALRDAIVKLGDDILRLTGQQEASAAFAKLGGPKMLESYPPPLPTAEKGKEKAPPLRRARSGSPAP
jgi:chromosome segregation ATPase